LIGKPANGFHFSSSVCSTQRRPNDTGHVVLLPRPTLTRTMHLFFLRPIIVVAPIVLSLGVV